MESQIQIQSEAMEIVIPSSGSNNVADRTRQQQRQQTTPNAAAGANPGRGNGQQKQQQQNQAGNMPRVLIVSPSVSHNATGPIMSTRSGGERKPIVITQQPQQQPSGLHNQSMPSRQIVIHQPAQSPKSSANQGPNVVVDNGHEQVATTATVQNGQLVIETRSRRQQQQQQILIIQQANTGMEVDEKEDELHTHDQSIPLGVAQTITVAVSDPEGRGAEASAIYPALQYVTSTGEPVVGAHAGGHHVVAAHHHSGSSGGGGGGPSAADATQIIYHHHSPVPTGNQHSAVHLQPGTYTVYPGDAGGYSPQGHHYYTGQVSYQTPLHSPASTYIIQSSGGGGLQHSPIGGPINPTIGLHEDDAAAQQLSHTTRASPATIQWLLQNYETAEGVSLPRCTLYNHYLKHCSEHKLDPVNAASFGKLIRIKPESPLNRISDESMATMAMRQQPTNQSRRSRPVVSTSPAPASQTQGSTVASGLHGQQALSASTGASVTNINPGGMNADTESASGTPNSIHSNSATAANFPLSTASQQQATSSSDGSKQYVGDGLVPEVMPPPLDHLEPSFERLGLSIEDAGRFFSAYRGHCEDILDCVKNLQFSDVERCWRQFWQPEEMQRSRQASSMDQDLESDLDEEDSLSFHNMSGLNRMQLYSMCTLPVVQEFVQTMDFQFYQVLIDVLIPNVLKSIPSALMQSIRNFAKRLENGLGLALQGAPDVIVRIKLDAVGSLAQTLRRYTSLIHLAQAARAALQNPAQIQQMLTDLNRVDFHNVQEQASWVCDCDPVLVDQIERDFKNALERQKTLEQWGSWLETVVDQVLGGCDVLNIVNGRQEHDASVVRLTTVARQFLLKWSFYSSMIMRDLTLRSAPSFGSYHLIRLLYDEYMFYLVEQRVARLTGQTTIAVMSQSYRNHVASLANGENEYHAYHLQQQQIQEQQQLPEGRPSQSKPEFQQAPESILGPAEGYQNQVDSGTHHFMHQQAGLLTPTTVDDGASSLAGVDTTTAGAEAIAVMTSGAGQPEAGSAASVVGMPGSDSSNFALHHNLRGEAQPDESEEGNVVDEYFIASNIQEEQQLNASEDPDLIEQGDTKAPLVSPTMSASQGVIEWDKQQNDQDTTPGDDQNVTSANDILEQSTPVKKRRLSLKFNGDAILE